MTSKTSSMPRNESQVTPYVNVSGAVEIIGYYTKVLGAAGDFRLAGVQRASRI